MSVCQGGPVKIVNETEKEKMIFFIPQWVIV